MNSPMWEEKLEREENDSTCWSCPYRFSDKSELEMGSWCELTGDEVNPQGFCRENGAW